MHRFKPTVCLVTIYGTAIFAAAVDATTFIEVTPKDDLRAIVESAPHNTVITLSAGTFDLGVHAPYDQGILIQNKSNLTIKGQGTDKTRLRLPSHAQFGFYTGSNTRDLTIKNLHLEGTLPLATNTHAIGNYSGTTNVHDVTFTHLRVSQTAVGISADTSNHGIYDGLTITNNQILGTVGLDPGWGYGIEISNPTNVLIADNAKASTTDSLPCNMTSPIGSCRGCSHTQHVLPHPCHPQATPPFVRSPRPGTCPCKMPGGRAGVSDHAHFRGDHVALFTAHLEDRHLGHRW